jgi:AcrR family transcriptional regulator
MGRPPKFSREQLQQAALAIVTADGLDALSMRSLAAALGTGPMTLYNHVADRADLDVLVVDAVMATISLPRPGVGPWAKEVEAIATTSWRAVRAHPAVVPLVLTRRSRSDAVLTMSDALAAALARGGLRGKALLHAFRAVTAYVAGFAQAELTGPLVGPDDDQDAVTRRILAGDHPALAGLAAVAARSDPETEFRAGLKALLRGFGAT